MYRKLHITRLEMLTRSAALALLLWWSRGVVAQQALPPAPVVESARPKYETIADGTTFILRFAQAVQAPPPLFRRKGSYKGDSVNLVAATEVRVNDRVVIAKGALAHATVAYSFYDYNGKYVVEHLGLKLDWVKSVLDTYIPLRGSATGHGAIETDIYSSNKGVEVRPASIKRSLIDGLTGRGLFTMWHKKIWIPVGARINVYTEGAQLMELPELVAAQERFPVRDDNAFVTIYRNKGQKDVQPWVSLAGKKLSQMSEHEYLTLTLRPGDYVLSAEPGKAAAFSFAAGQEYYFKLQGKKDNWELKTVDVVQADDEMADAVPSKTEAPLSFVDTPK